MKIWHGVLLSTVVTVITLAVVVRVAPLKTAVGL
jgi:hypothetical protein